MTLCAEPATRKYSIGSLTSKHLEEAISLLRSEPGVCFQEWERSLLESMCSTHSSLVLAATEGEQLVGLIACGVMGLRGTVNHVVVSPEFRGVGVASALVKRALDAMWTVGVRRVFLFTSAGNQQAERFWAQCGFRETTGEKTFEIDIDE